MVRDRGEMFPSSFLLVRVRDRRGQDEDNVGFIWRSVLSKIANGLVSRPCLLFVASRMEEAESRSRKERKRTSRICDGVQRVQEYKTGG